MYNTYTTQYLEKEVEIEGKEDNNMTAAHTIPVPQRAQRGVKV